jgi:hypothetical protein
MEKIDLVYILGTGSRWNDNEIRYSLRSVENYFPSAGRIFIIGECPDWATNIIHIKINDKFDNKLLNARAKYMVAATDKQISKNFILMNDDFFFLKGVNSIPNYSRGTMKEMMAKHPSKNGYYYRSLWDTQKRLDAMGIPDAIDFEVHAPIILNKEKLENVIWLIGEEKAYSIRSCYGNLVGLKPKKVMDFKAANIAEFAFQKMQRSEFLSINDALICDDFFRDWLKNKYPRKSKYEMDDGGLLAKPGRPVGRRRVTARKGFEYAGKMYNPGDVIAKEVWNDIKKNPTMIGVWKLD